MSPVPAANAWSLSQARTRRHVNVQGRAACNYFVTLGLDLNTAEVLAVTPCARCLTRTGGAQ